MWGGLGRNMLNERIKIGKSNRYGKLMYMDKIKILIERQLKWGKRFSWWNYMVFSFY